MALRPVGDVLSPLELEELDPGDRPLEAVTLVKVLDAAGDVRWLTTSTGGLTDAEVIGALITAADLERDRYRQAWDTGE